MEHLQSSDEDQVAAEVLAPAAEPQALVSSVVSASGQELPEVIFVGDDFVAESSKELNPDAQVFTPLADLDDLDFDSTGVLAYTPNSAPLSPSPERGPDGGAPVSTVNFLLVDASAVPAKKSTEPELSEPLLSPELNVPVRTWRGVQYHINSNGVEQKPNVEGVITPENPYGDPPPKKDRPVVVHPAVDAHMSAQKGGRKRPLKASLSVPQCRLIEADFKAALDDWDPVSFTGEIEMWKALEASRYCTNNPLHREGHADVNVAVRLLISARMAQGDPIVWKRSMWFVASDIYNCGRLFVSLDHEHPW